MPAPSPAADESMLKLLARLFYNLAWLLVPFIIPFYLPAALIPLWWALTHLAEWVENRLTGAVDHTFIWMLGGCFGLSSLVADQVSDSLIGTLAGIVCFIGLLLVHEGWRKLARLTIRKAPEGPRLTQTSPTPFAGPNAWNGAPLMTPEGEAVKTLSCSEFVMGGPAVCDYLLPDGSVICGGGASTGFSPDGRYFVTPAPSRSDWPLMIYDRRHCVLYSCDVQSRFWEIDLVGDLTISGRESPLVNNQTWTAMIDDLIAHSHKQDMVPVADLKIPQAQWEHWRLRHTQAFPAPAPAPALTADSHVLIDWKLHLPPSLATLDDPLDPLCNPMGEIIVNQQGSGLRVSMAFPVVVWRNDARALVCEATPIQPGSARAWWFWADVTGWNPLLARQDIGEKLPYAYRQEHLHLDEHCLTVEWALLQPELSVQTEGTLCSHTGGPLEINGQWFEPPLIRQRIPLPGQGTDKEWLESAPLHNDQALIWRLQHLDEGIDRHVYHCHYQGSRLEGQWLLDHRISSNGRSVALIACPCAPMAAQRMAIFDSSTATLHWLDGEYLDPRLQGFTEDTLYFVHMISRHPEHFEHTAIKPLR